VRDGRVEVQRYWRLDYSEKLDLPERICAKEMLGRLAGSRAHPSRERGAARAFLSGGVDSSAVVALAAEAMSEP